MTIIVAGMWCYVVWYKFTNASLFCASEKSVASIGDEDSSTRLHGVKYQKTNIITHIIYSVFNT